MKTKEEYLARARVLGSKAKTLRGVGRTILAHTRSVFQSSNRGGSRITRAAWYAQAHHERLVRRFVGVERLPRYLSASDRALIASDDAAKELAWLKSQPVYVRAFYLPTSSILTNPRFRAFVREAEARKGELVSLEPATKHAFACAAWGRLKKKYHGESCLHPKIRTVTRGWGWDKVSWHHADYTLILPPASTRRGVEAAYYIDTRGERHTVYVGSIAMSIAGSIHRLPVRSAPPRSLPVHVQRRILAPRLPSVLRLDYDRTAASLMLVDGYGEQYHLTTVTGAADAAAQVRAAIAAFRIRRTEKKRELAELASASGVWVSVEDSLRSGNCRSETDKFAAVLHRHIHAHGELGAVRGDVILAVRSDSYTRRAVAYAAARHHHQHAA